MSATETPAPAAAAPAFTPISPPLMDKVFGVGETKTVTSAEWGATPELTASCYCGKCKWEARGKEIFTAYCHCTICQRISGGVTSIFVGYTPDNVRLVEGKEFMEFQQASAGMKRWRCKNCASPTIGESLNPAMPIVDFPVTSLARCPKGFVLACPGPVAGQDKAKAKLVPSCHIFYGTRMQDMKDGLPKFEGMPGTATLPETHVAA